MKLKITEHNGALMLSVLGSRQELIIREDGGGFALELHERVWWEEPLHADNPVFEPETTQEETRQVEVTAEVSAEEETRPVKLPAVEPESEMFTKLANLRREIASADKVPPYMVFHDKALWAMVETMPQDLAAFGKIVGVGQAKLEKYGERFLAVINGSAA